MIGRIAYTDEFKPDFGLPWPRRYQNPDFYKDWTDDEVREELRKKILFETNAQQDPINFGWTLESWREVWEEWTKYNVHCILGGNRSGKSVSVARLVMWCALTIPEARIRCFQVNDAKSIAEQQSYIWDALPQRFKTAPKKRGTNHSLTFTQMNGFTNNKLILPPHPGYKRGSEIIFGTFQSYRNDPQVIEGWSAHLVWLDEEAPQKMFERLLTRLYDFRGRMVLTFTTIQGWSPLVADILGRTKTLRKRRSELLKRDIPVAQESLSRKGTRIYYYWTQDNPFIPDDALKALEGRPVEEILSVAHGIPTKPALSKFPKFDETVHVIPHETLPWLKVKEGEKVPEITFYQVTDPSGRKPWFVGWFGVDIIGRLYLWAEFPDIAYGAWGEVGENSDGKPGPAYRPNGWGYDSYCEMFKHTEEGCEIFERYIDPRLSAAKGTGEEGATTLLTELEDALRKFEIQPDAVIPAPGLKIDHGLSLINDRLHYDQSKPIDILNSPRFFISDRCQNTIEAFKNYSGSGPDEVWKDPIDVVRMMIEAGADFVPKSSLTNPSQTFSY